MGDPIAQGLVSLLRRHVSHIFKTSNIEDFSNQPVMGLAMEKSRLRQMPWIWMRELR